MPNHAPCPRSLPACKRKPADFYGTERGEKPASKDGIFVAVKAVHHVCFFSDGPDVGKTKERCERERLAPIIRQGEVAKTSRRARQNALHAFQTLAQPGSAEQPVRGRGRFPDLRFLRACRTHLPRRSRPRGWVMRSENRRRIRPRLPSGSRMPRRNSPRLPTNQAHHRPSSGRVQRAVNHVFNARRKECRLITAETCPWPLSPFAYKKPACAILCTGGRRYADGHFRWFLRKISSSMKYRGMNS